jgi:serine/threonine protein kinase/Flp pilus assembly protein TadD
VGADVDRNLLFGILALQNNFVGREALLSAFNSWVVDKSLCLGDLFCERGALAADERSLLDALVAEHLERFENDPVKSLASLSSIGSVRDELSRLGDEELQQSLRLWGADHGRKGKSARLGGLETATPLSVGEPTSAGGRFRVLRPHARGGLGEVFVARDTELNRDVALKEIQDDYADDPRYRAKFVYEAEVTGGLEHPGIVPVYGLGHTPEGRPFYAMRFIKGDRLKDAIKRFHEAERQLGRDAGERTLALRELLGRFIDVCDAIAFAHSRGVLHRDLKPGNIMLGRYGETLVVDWGLAKALDRQESGPAGGTGQDEPPLSPASGSTLEPTLTGKAIGTPAYMSPEQVDSRLHGPAGVSSDVYCLGATLYHLLTGQPPCVAEDPGEIYKKVLAGEIPRPRSLSPRLSPALEAVCMKAMARHPESRYESARALARDVQRWLADEPVTAWREPLRIRAGRWIGRHRTEFAACFAFLVTAIVALAIGTVVLGLEKNRTERARQFAMDEEREAKHQAKVARTNEAEALSQQHRAETNFARVLAAADRNVFARAAELAGQGNGSLTESNVGTLLEDTLSLYRSLVDETGDDRVPADARSRYHVVIGMLLKAAGRADEAITAYRKGVEVDPHNSAAYAGLGVALNERREFGEAAKGLRKAVELNPRNVNARVHLSLALNELRRYDESIPFLRETVKIDPKNATAYNNLGDAFIGKGRWDEAITVLRKAIELDPRHFWAHYNLGIALDRRRQFAESLSILRNAVTLDAKHVDARVELSLALIELQRFDESIPILHEAIRLDPKCATAYNNLGVALIGKRQFGESIPILQEAIRLDPRYVLAHSNLAIALNEQARYDEAIDVLRRGIELDPKSTTLLTNFASSLARKGRNSELLGVLRRRVEAQPNNAPIHIALGVALTTMSRFNEAVPVLRRALALDPKYAAARESLVVALLASGQDAEAEPLLRDMVESYRKLHGSADPSTVNAIALLGMSLIHQSKWIEAEPILRECLSVRLKRQPDDWSTFNIKSLLGGSLLGQFRHAEAEPLVVSGYEGMKARESTIPVTAKLRLHEAAERVVRLYEAWAKPEQAMQWRTRLSRDPTDLPLDVFARH